LDYRLEIHILIRSEVQIMSEDYCILIDVLSHVIFHQSGIRNEYHLSLLANQHSQDKEFHWIEVCHIWDIAEGLFVAETEGRKSIIIPPPYRIQRTIEEKTHRVLFP